MKQIAILCFLSLGASLAGAYEQRVLLVVLAFACVARAISP
jgi:hypothetical protein